jgi:hypothetical protein
MASRIQYHAHFTNVGTHFRKNSMDLIKQVKSDPAVAAGLASVAAAAGFVLYKKIAIPGSVIETERNGGELVANVLRAHGTGQAFCGGISFVFPCPFHVCLWRACILMLLLCPIWVQACRLCSPLWVSESRRGCWSPSSLTGFVCFPSWFGTRWPHFTRISRF